MGTAELEKLCNTERDRSILLCVSIVESERSVLHQIEKVSTEFMDEMAEVTKSLLHLLDTTVAPWDIRDMRTSAEIEEAAAAKKRPTLKTLRKMKSKEESGKTVPAGTIVVKDWPSLPSGELRIKQFLPGLTKEESIIAAKDKLAAASGEEEEEEEEAAASDAEKEEEVFPPGDPITSRTTTASRSTVRWRDRVYTEYKSYFHQMCAKYKMRFDKLLEGERTWAENWNKMCGILKKKSEEGGIL